MTLYSFHSGVPLSLKLLIMNKETIEKAANVEMLSYYADEEYPSDIKDIQSDFIEAFQRGAHWRISSVWHDEFEAPESGKYVLAINGNKHGCRILWMNTNPVNWDEYVEANGIKRWAYVDDLLPDEKEEAL